MKPLSKAAYDTGYRARSNAEARSNPYINTKWDAYAKDWDKGYDTADRHIREKD